ncbi:hemicentin-2-like [Mercenaria mercenaria]|uniref:hemicentin-2-like n=1 Tax=Mercenaria mercenaria TaxID=6596 RepID=UPI00234EFEF2|nr:hemicentin-2-like [Mercenaria mercenaria]
MFPLVLVVLTFLVCSSDGSDVVLGILGNSAFIECQLPISNTLIWQTENGNVIAMNGRVINENSTKYLIEKQNGLRESLVIHDLTLADDNIFRCFDLKNRTFVDSTKLNVLAVSGIVKLLMMEEGPQVLIRTLLAGICVEPRTFSKPAGTHNAFTIVFLFFILYFLARAPMMNVTVTPPQPMLEGTEVTLTCEADGGKPLPEIRWFIKSTNGSVTEVNGNVTDIKYPNGTGHRTNTLRTTVTRDLYRATFICNITVSLLYQETFTVDTDVLLAPLKPEITSRDYDGSFDENSVLKVQCSSKGGRPTPTIYWLLDGNRVGDVEVVVKTHENGTATVVSNLSKQMSRVYNGSVLTCAATNRVLLDQGLPPRVANITLLASYKPNVWIEQHEYTTKLGDNVTFNCNIDANPLPYFEQLYWTNKGVMVDRKYYYLSNESDVFSLNLQDVEITDTGYYACHAVNRLGASSSEQIKLTVLYAPVCGYSSVQKVAVRLGEGAGLNCSMMASPNDVMFTWRYRQNDERITKMRATKDMRSIDHVYGVLDLTVGSQIRYGEIECHGNNTQGMSLNPCIFEIVPPGPPEIPGNCSTTVDKSQVQIKCVAGFNGGSTQHFILQKLGNIEFQTLLANDIPDFQFNSYENVTIRICAYNDDYKNIRNCAIPSEIVVYVPAFSDVPQSDPVKGEKSHKTAYIAGGVIAAFGVIIIAIIVSVLLFRRYKKVCYKVKQARFPYTTNNKLTSSLHNSYVYSQPGY